MQDYRKLVVWNKVHELVVYTYRVTAKYPQGEVYALVQQMRKAAGSIPMNIAEGSGRNSNADFAHFLNIALGSSNEIEYQYLLSKDLSYISEKEYTEVILKLGEIKGMLIGLISKVREKG
ncbi:MAG: four helix bundle protein [Bacteroides sp.]|nr:four helix bundle protein [Bacteroides sp.]